MVRGFGLRVLVSGGEGIEGSGLFGLLAYGTPAPGHAAGLTGL